MKEEVAFFTLEPTKDKKGVIGAILVVDDLGMPQEFRVTYPVKPTTLQKQLYGNSLNVHIGVTLCGEPLYKALRNKPELLLVNHKQHLSLAAKVDSEVALVDRVGEAIVVGEEDDQRPSIKVHSKTDRFQPLNIFCHDLGDHDQEKIKSLVEKYFQSIDLMEPFDRIKGALEALGEQDERFN